jgi:serine phosphatase RsbU (regulator of sigma subunit)
MLGDDAMTGRLRPWLTMRVGAGVLAIAVLGFVYPLVAEVADQPLTMFLVPVLVVAAWATWRETFVVAVVALLVAVVDGAATPGLGAGGLIARTLIVLVGSAVGIAVAAERARRDRLLEQAHVRAAMSEAFQSSLLPSPLPPAFMIVTVRFEPGDDRLALGGDFFDALELTDGSMGYVIGDVCGHGAEAAALGSALRAGWKTIANAEPADPVAWVFSLQSAFFRYGRHGGFATLNTGRVARGDDRVLYVSAGHPWPVLLDGDVRLHTPQVGPPLGAVRSPSWVLSEAPLGPGETMLLYTDGLIENGIDHRRPLDGERALVDYLRSAPSLELAGLIRHFGPTGFSDDVAVVALRNAGVLDGATAELRSDTASR